MLKLRSMKILLLCVAAMTIVCCNKFEFGSQGTPEKVTSAFIWKSSSAKKITDKDQIAVLCTGLMREVFERMDEDRFKESYLNASIDIKKLEIFETRTEDDIATVKYRLTVIDKRGEHPAEEQIERELTLRKVDSGNWFRNKVWAVQWIRALSNDKIAFTQEIIF